MNTTITTTAKVWAEQGPDPGALVWVMISLYLAVLLGIAVFSFFRGTKGEDMNAQMKDYFLANRGLSDIVLALTIFSTCYSGYTVVGVPEEMYKYGFFSYRWLFTILPFIIPLLFFGARLNYLSLKRDYISPTGFIVDRYNSHLLRVAVSLTLIFPTVIYVLAQFESMGATVSSLSNGNIDAFLGSSVLCVIMLLYELFGGLRAIAWTDAIQGAVMTFGFLIFYIVQAEVFDGVEAAGNYMEGLGLNKTLSKDLTTQWFSFGCSLFFGYMFYPQMIQRYQAASSPSSFRKSIIFLTFGTWLAFTSSLCTGMVAMHHFGFSNPNIGTNETFGATLRVVISKGAGWNIFGSLIFTSSLAAFMSTADSAVNGATCCVCLDLVKPYAKYYKYPFRCCMDQDRSQTWSQTEIKVISKLVSIIIAVGALLLNEYVDFEMGALLQMQNAVLCQLFPAYFLGMTTNFVQSYPVLVGWAFGMVCFLVVQCDNVEDCNQSGVEWYWPIDRLHPAFFGLIVNFTIALFGSFLLQDRRLEWDTIKLDHEFPPELTGLNITGSKRPWHWPYILILVPILILSFFSVPWYREPAEVETFTGGLPEFIRVGYVLSAVGTVLALVAMTFFWEDDETDNEVGGTKIAMTSVIQEVPQEDTLPHYI